MNIITLEAHSRDINAKMIRLKVDRVDHFEWLGQLKTNWEKHSGHGGQTPALDRNATITPATSPLLRLPLSLTHNLNQP